MFNQAHSVRFIAFASLMLSTLACSNANTDSASQPTAAGPKAPAASPNPKEKEDKPKAPSSDNELIQGAWNVEGCEFQGKKENLGKDEKLTLIFKGDKLVTKQGDDAETGTFRLDSSKTPKTIDLGRRKDVVPGIYELKDDQLKIAFVRDPKGKRPTSFETGPGSEAVVWVLKKDKNAQEYKEPDGKGFAEAIAGKWKSSSLSDYSFPFFLGKEFEFTKDGRVLENDESKKEWIEKYTYRFDKAELVLTPSGTDKEKRKEQRVKILKITDDELDSLSPRGKLKRIK